MKYLEFLSVVLNLILTSTSCSALKDSTNKTLEQLTWSSCVWDTPWIKGYGIPIESWLKSITKGSQLVFDKDQGGLNKSNLNVVTKFSFQPVTTHDKSDSTNELRAVEIWRQNSNLRWKKYGHGLWDGWLYGRMDEHYTGDEIAYIYSDFRTVIYGKFSNGVLIEGREKKIKGFRCKSGMLELQFTRTLNRENVYRYEETNATFITSQPTLTDPFERRTIYISNSTIPGMVCSDGVFAKRDIPANALVAIYAGLRVPDLVYHDNMTTAEKENVHKNLLSFNSEYNLDIPPSMDNIVNYRATLGHKFNHRFDGISIEFCYMKHPRFGSIRCLKSTRNIRRGEEIFINYGYDMTNNDAPDWYTKLYQEFYFKPQ